MAESKLLNPGQKVKPVIKHGEVLKIVQQLYKINVASIVELNSYDDRNFLIQSDTGPRYVFKISNYLDSSTPGLIGKAMSLNEKI